MTPAEQIEQFIAECLSGTDTYLVSYHVKPTNNYKVFLDSDEGFTLKKCIAVNRKLRAMVDESGLYPEGDYSIEVSSPGVDAPLKLARQYQKNMGRKLEIHFLDETKEPIEARLMALSDEGITVEPLPKTQKGRVAKASTPPMEILFQDIKEAVVQIEF
jgi:ribosome maturation factor RimP